MSKNSNYKLPISMYIFAFSAVAGILLAAVIIELSSNTPKGARQVTNPHTMQAGKWMLEVSASPASPEREVFISELGVAMSDGTISDEEHANLSVGFQVLINKEQ